MKAHRLAFIDGLRGLAILWVIIFHAYARWPALVPYGADYALPFVKMGIFGVQLFFLISGFVIFMTLDNTESLKSFLFKRWLRLFPAMLIAVCLILLTAQLFSERPAGDVQLISLLPSLTFVEPDWWSLLLGFDISPLEGAFWSIFAEFKFYVIAGLVYFFLGRKFLIPALVTMFTLNIFSILLDSQLKTQTTHLINALSIQLSLDQFGWFSAGAAFYRFYDMNYPSLKSKPNPIESNKSYTYFWLGILLCIVSAIFVKNYKVEASIAALFVSSVFFLSLNFNWIQKIFSQKLFIFLGFISYPLYLIHENIMIASIIKLSKAFSNFPSALYPVIPIFILGSVAYIIAKYLEPYLKKLVSSKTLSQS